MTNLSPLKDPFQWITPAREDWLITDEPPFVRAVLEGDAARVAALIQEGGPLPLWRGTLKTPLLVSAIARGYGDVCQELLTVCDPNQEWAEGLRPLHSAAFHNMDQPLQVLLKDRRVLINCPDNTGDTPLMRAVQEQSFECAQLLVNAKCNLEATNLNGETALRIATDRGYIRLQRLLERAGAGHRMAAGSQLRDLACQQLLNYCWPSLLRLNGQRFPELEIEIRNVRKAFINILPLMKSCRRFYQARGHWMDQISHYSRRISEIYRRAAQVTRRPVLEEPTPAQSRQLCQTLEGSEPLFPRCACERDTDGVDQARALIDLGLDPAIPDHHGLSALVLAAISGNWRLAETLARWTCANVPDRTGRLPLVEAARCGRVLVISTLMETTSLQLNQTDRDGYTALMVSSYWGVDAVVRQLLKYEETDPNLIHASTGDTALKLAVRRCHKHVVRLLLQNPRTDPHQPDHRGRTALDYAVLHPSRSADYQEVLRRLLIAKGAMISQGTN
jgi:ankyrin repeat protein